MIVILGLNVIPVRVLAAPLFTQNLREGDTSVSVSVLQSFLDTHGFPVAVTGPGSVNATTDYFGTLTKAALIHL